MQILVVDDDQAVRDSLQRSLQYNGYQVSTAEDGLQALARLAAHRPDAAAGRAVRRRPQQQRRSWTCS